MSFDGSLVIERLRELPGGSELLAVAREHGDVELVGGAVRDILLGRTPRELDVVVGADATAFAAALARRLQTLSGQDPGERLQTHLHDRFRTALVRWDNGEVDIATRRKESYAAPGALPEVREGTLEQDLARRDFTVNAIAVALDGANAGQMRAAPRALEDLERRRLRVLHERSFIDDPTRLLRLTRYAARLDFQIEPRTEELAAQALAVGALSTVSGARIGAELRLALAEAEPLAAIEEMSRLGLLKALDPELSIDGSLVRRAMRLLPADDGRPDLLVLASLMLDLVGHAGSDPGGPAYALLSDWQFSAQDRERVLGAALTSRWLAGELSCALPASRLHTLASRAPLEGVALAGALGGSDCERVAKRWLEETRKVALAITGEDLLAAGVPQGPEIGLRLNVALAMRLDGEVDDMHERQLRAALEAQV